uniref:F-box domain-containing protein n=1 Tax=Panagrellus redivivus TaxID=6233 RepID=A0A7E4VHM8_PANRE
MNSTVKPHLLVEVMGLPSRQPLPPEKLCMLFLSYREFPDAFALAFRYRCEVRHHWPPFFEFWIRAPCGILFVFDKKLHIPTLLRLAGRLTRRLEAYVYKHAWLEPFLEGIDENQHMEFIHFKAGLHFLERYLRHHDNRLPTVECYRFSMFDKLGDPFIEKLIVNEKPKDANNERCRIENIVVGSIVTRSIWQPINICGKVLKVNTKVLKSLTVRGGVPYRAALRMITETYSKIERLQFNFVEIEFGPRSREYPDYMNRINGIVQAFKTAMHNHPGAVSVSAVYYGHKTRPGPALAETCRTTLTGFTVKLAEIYPGGPDYIVCKFQSNEGNKSLNVKARLYEH